MGATARWQCRLWKIYFHRLRQRRGSAPRTSRQDRLGSPQFNDAPLSTDVAYTWIAREVTSELRIAIPQEDIDDLRTLEKILGPELGAIRKGALSLLEPNSIEYKTRLADEILKLQTDAIVFAKCVARYVCAGPGKLLIIVLDNCDKRTRDEQLTMFQSRNGCDQRLDVS